MYTHKWIKNFYAKFYIVYEIIHAL
jgi:hypothetical protein